jgi:hypothetical protein
MMMLMIGIVVGMRMGMASSVGMDVFVLVEDDLQPAPEGIGNAAQRGEARKMVAPLEARDHRLGHRKPVRELLLCLAGVGAKLEYAVGASRRNGGAIVEDGFPR